MGSSSHKRQGMMRRKRGHQPPIQETRDRRPYRRSNRGRRRRKSRKKVVTRSIRPRYRYLGKSYSPELLYGKGGRSPVPYRGRGNYYTLPTPPNNWSGPTCRFAFTFVHPTALVTLPLFLGPRGTNIARRLTRAETAPTRRAKGMRITIQRGHPLTTAFPYYPQANTLSDRSHNHENTNTVTKNTNTQTLHHTHTGRGKEKGER